MAEVRLTAPLYDLFAVNGIAGAHTEAQKLQKQEELRLGLTPVDAKELRARRRAGEGAAWLGKSNKGVSARQEQDKAADLVWDCSPRFLTLTCWFWVFASWEACLLPLVH